VTVFNTRAKLESLVKLVTSADEIHYWRTEGLIEPQKAASGATVELITGDDVVKSCILQNEVKVRG